MKCRQSKSTSCQIVSFLVHQSKNIYISITGFHIILANQTFPCVSRKNCKQFTVCVKHTEIKLKKKTIQLTNTMWCLCQFSIFIFSFFSLNHPAGNIIPVFCQLYCKCFSFWMVPEEVSVAVPAAVFRVVFLKGSSLHQRSISRDIQ